MKPFSTILLALISVASLLPSVTPLSVHSPTRATVPETKYSRAHHLDDSYAFDPRDGWETINVAARGYNSTVSQLGKRAAKNKVVKSTTGGLDTLKKVLKGMVGIGEPDPVKITW